MIGILTGEILNPRNGQSGRWPGILKSELSLSGESPACWEMFSSNSFILRIDDPLKAILIATRIKAAIKTVKFLDVKLAIGIGEESYQGDKISECTGPAFIFSKERFDTLKRDKLKLGIKTSWPVFDAIINLCFKLSRMAMDNWSVSSAEAVRISLAHPDASQAGLGKLMGNIRQNAVSTRLSRAHFNELMEFNDLYRNMLEVLI
jgi:hypothetical protein